ncbi:hypothetical protein MJ560_23085 [Klebsiella pneumoniae]|nr:hypothetical protein MJ560_23085 [Klebsiella pneumoniae]
MAVDRSNTRVASMV